MTILWTSVAVLLVLFSIIAHETAHGVVLRRLGVRVVEFGIGLPFRPRMVFPPSRLLPFRVSLSPWLVGAYVTPDPQQQKELDALSYRDSVWYASVGVIINLVLGFAGSAVVSFFGGHLYRVLFDITVASVLWFFRRLISSYVIPILGVVVLLFFVYILAISVGQPQGVVGLGSMIVSLSFIDALYIGSVVSISLGLINLVPIYPLDGGRVMSAFLARFVSVRVASLFRSITTFLTMSLIVYCTFSDIWWLLGLIR